MKPYVEFSFGGITSSSLKIKRVSNGSRYTEPTLPTLKDNTIDIPGGDGQYLVNTKYSSRTFTVNFAFDSMTMKEIRQLKNVFNGKELKKLIFGEQEDRYWLAKVTNISLTYVPFKNRDNLSEDIYKGEGTIQFISYSPFALAIDEKIRTKDSQGEEDIQNLGDVPTPFKMDSLKNGDNTAEYFYVDGVQYRASIKITGRNDQYYIWDSGLGIIYEQGNPSKIVPATVTLKAKDKPDLAYSLNYLVPVPDANGPKAMPRNTTPSVQELDPKPQTTIQERYL